MQDLNGRSAQDGSAQDGSAQDGSAQDGSAGRGRARPPNSAAADPGRWCYAAQALGLVFYVLTTWLEVYLDTRKETAPGANGLWESHRQWRLRSSLLFFTWTILGGMALPFGFGLPVMILAWLWFAARVAIGWIYWERGRVIGQRRRARRPGPRPGLGRIPRTQLSEPS